MVRVPQRGGFVVETSVRVVEAVTGTKKLETSLRGTIRACCKLQCRFIAHKVVSDD